MKKYILKILVLFLLSQYANAQQFEWVKTFEGRGASALNQSTLNDLCNAIKINNDILLIFT